MIISEKQIKSCFTKSISDLKGEITTALCELGTIDMNDFEERSDAEKIIFDVLEEYEILVSDSHYSVETK